MPPLPASSFRLTAVDLRILESIRVKVGLATRAEAFRYLLREWERRNRKPRRERVQ